MRRSDQIVSLADEDQRMAHLSGNTDDLYDASASLYKALCEVFPYSTVEFTLKYFVSGWRAAERFYNVKEPQ